MRIIKYIPYIYLIIGVMFVYDGILKFNTGENTFWLSFVFAAVAIFMFFFRRNFNKKMENRNQK